MNDNNVIRIDDTEPNAQVITLDPALATKLLDANPRNRRKSRSNYATVVRAIERGEWMVNGEAIKVATDGYLLDGQHRCAAVVETGKSIETFLITGLPPETQDTMDTGKSRSLGDMLHIRDEANSGALAAVIRRFYILEKSGLIAAIDVRGAHLTHKEQLEWFSRNTWARDYVAPGKAVGRHTALSGALASLLIKAFDDIDSDDSEFFWARVMDGLELSAADPIYALRKAFDSIGENQIGERNQRYLAALTIKAWNAYRRGDEMRQARYRIGGSNPEAFPLPI